MGSAFRKKREEMNLTLKEVENATSIRMVYLQAIEEGRVDHFLSRVYALGFIRQYGSFLGYENEKLSKEFPEALKIPLEKQEFSYGIGTMEVRSSPNAGIKWIPNLMKGLAVGSVIFCAWLFAKFLGLF